MSENNLSEKKEFVHYTVMKNEVVDSLNCYNSDKIFVDCTLGGGGHSEEILKRISPNGRLISFDVDDDAINHASNRLKDYKGIDVELYNMANTQLAIARRELQSWWSNEDKMSEAINKAHKCISILMYAQADAEKAE